MKKETIESLVKKYREGNTTLKEEEFLKDNVSKSDVNIHNWLSNVGSKKNDLPQDFEESMWRTFQDKTSNKRKLSFELFSAAASILLLITLMNTNFESKELSYSEKEALLKEALSLYDSTETSNDNESIFYQDEIVVIYKTTD